MAPPASAIWNDGFFRQPLWIIYLGPTWVAGLGAVFPRHFLKSRRPIWQIFLVNLLTGWTVIGWIVAWAMVIRLDSPTEGKIDQSPLLI